MGSSPIGSDDTKNTPAQYFAGVFFATGIIGAKEIYEMTAAEKTRKVERLTAKLLPFAVVPPALAAWLTKQNHHP